MTSDLHDLTDRELYRMSFDIAEVLVARAKCRLAEEAGIPSPVAMARRMAPVSVGGTMQDTMHGPVFIPWEDLDPEERPGYSVKV